MRREHLDDQMRKAWRESVVSLDEATRQISDVLKCGLSKADKIATGRYPNRLSQLELNELRKLMAQPSKGVVTTPKKKGA